MKHYTLTAEQMQQVREAVEKATTGLKRMLDMYEPDTFPANHPAALAREGLVAAQTALAILDAAMQAPEATAGGDVREAVALALAEVEKATRKFPTWPTDPLHALAVLGEEFGELTKEMLQSVYEPHKTVPEKVRTEAIQTAAMALRLLASLDRYEYARGPQHSQAALAAAPKPCEHGCVDGVTHKELAGGFLRTAPCPDHGTKPEAPMELCATCGEGRYATPHLNFRRLGTNHPFTPTDAKGGA